MARLMAVLLLVTLLWPVIPVRSGGDEAGTGAVAVATYDDGADRDGAGRVESSRPRVWANTPEPLGETPRALHPVRPLVHVPESPVIAVTIPEPARRGSPSGHTVVGTASRMGAGFGRRYLALPEGKGHRVRICAKRCLTMTSTDAGPDKAMQRAGRVCDMNDWAWAYVTGLPLSRGLGKVSVTYL